MKKKDTIVSSEKMKEVFRLAKNVAQYDSPVLIQGETGTGKEVIAQFIHDNSPRKHVAFVKVNCPSVPIGLFESELFGHEPGSFTGARAKGKAGVVELANRGTLLLDEIGELPLIAQPKLLRVLQEKELYRVGSGIIPTKVDVRFISATNKDLAREVELGNFRSDLYYRLKVVLINVPPLRERIEDVDRLLDYFIERLNKKYNRSVVIGNDAREELLHYSYPGNVRELENLVEYLFVIAINNEITLEHLPMKVINDIPPQGAPIYNSFGLESMLNECERRVIFKVLSQNGSIRQTAKSLGLSPSTLHRRIQKHGIRIEDEKNMT